MGRWWSSELGWMGETENRAQNQLEKGGWPQITEDLMIPNHPAPKPTLRLPATSPKVTSNLDHLSFNSNLFICQSFKSNSPSFNSSCSPFQTNVLPVLPSSSPFRYMTHAPFL